MTETLSTALLIVAIAGTAGLSIACILSRANARVEYEEMISKRIARFAGVNRKV